MSKSLAEDFVPPADAPTELPSDGGLYSQFAPDIRWIQKRIRADCETLPVEVQGVAKYYLTQRLKVLHDANSVSSPHPLSPRPIPYLAFWFTRAFGVADAQVRRLLGLSLAYVCLSVSPRDDLLDGFSVAPHQQMYLSRWFWEKYFLALKKLFPAESPIWYLLSKSTAEWECGERWMLCQKENASEAANPLSLRFLRNSARYLVALLFPTLAGAALLGNQPEKVAVIRRFACHYCMGWRILDDLRDWQDDILQVNTNESSVLSFLRIRAAIPRNVPITRELAVSLFSDQAVVEQIYSAMSGFFVAARRQAEKLQATYVTRFIDEQLRGHQAELARIAAEKIKFSNDMARLLGAENGFESLQSQPSPSP
jgi:hypothetical protein